MAGEEPAHRPRRHPPRQPPASVADLRRHYGRAGLHEADLAADPMTQFGALVRRRARGRRGDRASPTRWCSRPSAATARRAAGWCCSRATTSAASSSSPTTARARVSRSPATRRSACSSPGTPLERQVVVTGDADPGRPRRDARPTSGPGRTGRSSAPGPARSRAVVADREELDAAYNEAALAFPEGFEVPRARPLGWLRDPAVDGGVLAGTAGPDARPACATAGATTAGRGSSSGWPREPVPPVRARHLAAPGQRRLPLAVHRPDRVGGRHPGHPGRDPAAGLRADPVLARRRPGRARRARPAAGLRPVGRRGRRRGRPAQAGHHHLVRLGRGQPDPRDPGVRRRAAGVAAVRVRRGPVGVLRARLAGPPGDAARSWCRRSRSPRPTTCPSRSSTSASSPGRCSPGCWSGRSASAPRTGSTSCRSRSPSSP